MTSIEVNFSDGESDGASTVSARVETEGSRGWWRWTVKVARQFATGEVRRHSASLTIEGSDPEAARVRLSEDDAANPMFDISFPEFLERGGRILEVGGAWVSFGDPFTDCAIKTGLSIGVRRAWQCGRLAAKVTAQMRTLEVFFDCVAQEPRRLVAEAAKRFTDCIVRNA